MTSSWDPDRYLAYADQRGRPFVELLARVGAESPEAVADLGCGPGNLTRLLLDRWPDASVVGIDSSPEMVARAHDNGIRAEVADIRDWAAGTPESSLDVVITNAALQWVPGHLGLLPRLTEVLRPCGWFAMQVPGNLDEPSHTVRQELSAEPEYAEYVGHIDEPVSHAPADYWRVLTDAGLEVDAWETTYLHVLTGEDAVYDWISGTSVLPTKAALPAELWPAYEAELRRRLRAAYPARDGQVRLPFRRVFAVGRRRP